MELRRLEPLRLRVDGHHRVGDVRVDAAEAVHRPLDHLGDLVLARDVRGDGEALGAAGLDLADGVLERLGVPRGDDHARAAPRGPARDRAAESARRAGHHHDLLGERLLARHAPASTRTRYA